ncbi:MAG: hypothetical protein U5K27_02300 [Desulfotignum sp.]|nr:hypothetical protein [Desulfotignum sp.]
MPRQGVFATVRSGPAQSGLWYLAVASLSERNGNTLKLPEGLESM